MADLVNEAVAELTSRARREIDEGLLPSCQIALALNGEIVHAETFGDAPKGNDSSFLMYSATKGVISAAVLQLLSEGSLRLEDNIADHLPGFEANGKAGITVQQVMTYTSGFATAPMGPAVWATEASRLRQMAEWKLTGTPGVYDYHITSAHWVLAALLERIDGVDYRQSVTDRIAGSLGLPSLSLGLSESEQGDLHRPVLCGVPATAAEFEEKLGIKGIDPGEASDDNLLALGQPEIVAAGLPGGGATSTASDVALLYQALMHNPDDVWDPTVLTDATSNVRITAFDSIRGVPANRSIAFMIAGEDGKSGGRGLGHGASPAAFGHDGIGGQLAFADPRTGLSFSYLTNGIDRNILRQQNRARSIATRANVCMNHDS